MLNKYLQTSLLFWNFLLFRSKNNRTSNSLFRGINHFKISKTFRHVIQKKKKNNPKTISTTFVYSNKNKQEIDIKIFRLISLTSPKELVKKKRKKEKKLKQFQRIKLTYYSDLLQPLVSSFSLINRQSVGRVVPQRVVIIVISNLVTRARLFLHCRDYWSSHIVIPQWHYNHALPSVATECTRVVILSRGERI